MNQVEETLKTLIKKALYNAFSLETNDIHLEKPSEKSHGDYATNIAMTLAKTLRKNPMAIGEEIIASLEENPIVENVELARPGFINFFVDKSVFFTVISEILSQKEKFGDGTIGEDRRVNIEFVSANPTGSLHVGHARGAAAGDTMARIMKKAGFEVTKEFYVNDGGKQIENLAKSVEARYKQLFGIDAAIPEDGYHGREIRAIAQAMKEAHGDRFLKEDGLDTFREEGVKRLLEGLKEDLFAFGVEFDVFFSEKSLYEEGEVEKTLGFLQNEGHTYKHEGALFLKTTAFGDEKDRVVVKSDGHYTYLLPDIAYHKNKLSRGFDLLIDILGGDHHGYIPRLKAGIRMVGGEDDTLEVDILQMVKVLQDGKEIKMSKRSGKAITLRDLIDAVGSDAVRYFFAKHSLNTHMDLDLDLAIKQSNDNPVYYAQYAHARIMSVFRKAQEEQYDIEFVNDEFTHLDHEKVYDLLDALSEYPALIEDAAKTRNFHKVTNYIHDLAQKLHTLYSAFPFLVDKKRARNERLSLLEAVRIVLKDALRLIGVDAPEKM